MTTLNDIAGYLAPDYLEDGPHFDTQSIKQIREERNSSLFDTRFEPYVQILSKLAPEKSSLDAKNSYVKIDGQRPQDFDQAIDLFRPWKKGPFELFGTKIDAEWRSDLKWERIAPHVSPLTDRTVCDIGCHNGYFMFRMTEQNPHRVIGIEPVQKHWFNFQLIQRYAQCPNLYFEMLGVEHMHHYHDYFDTVFCLGILYHHTDPVGMLRKIKESMKKGGELIIDCQGIPGDDSIALFPKGRYARAKGIWFLPTLSCLENMLIRSGFRNISCFYNKPLSVDEQRSTDFANIDSLEQFLDPTDPSKTVEGYPAPYRFYVKAIK